MLESLSGFKYDKGYFERIRGNLMRGLAKPDDEEELEKIHKKIEAMRMAEVRNLLFEPLLQREMNRRSGNQEITRWFARKS